MIINHIPASEKYYIAGRRRSLVIKKGSYDYCFSNNPYKSGWHRLDYGQDRFLGDRADWEEITEQEMQDLLNAVQEGFA